MYKKLKKQNGEAFAQTLRNFHNGILEIPDLDVILRHAGRDAKPLLPYLMGLLAPVDTAPVTAPADPFALLDQAGYEAFHADTLEKQNSIEHYFDPDELLCTFTDHARYEDYHIVHAVKKDATTIERQNFSGKEERQDSYGTSVVSIQMVKSGGFISIKNRYNHAVSGCDNTFESNPDNIIEGLSAALKQHFDVEFAASKFALPDGYVSMDNRVFKYNAERDNIYYGDQAWAQNGVIHAVKRSAGDALFDEFLFDNKTKTLKNIDPESSDSFADDFNRCYGGNRGLSVQNGNLTLNGAILIGAEQSRIETLNLPALTTMGNHCLHNAGFLIHFKAPALTTMGDLCFHNADDLVHFEAPALTAMGNSCFRYARGLTDFETPALTTMGKTCLIDVDLLTHFIAPSLITMGNDCLCHVRLLTHFKAPALTTMGDGCLCGARALIHFEVPALTTMGHMCLSKVPALTHFTAPTLTLMGNGCLDHAPALTHFEASALTTMGNYCLYSTPALTRFAAPALITRGKDCLAGAHNLTIRPRIQQTEPAFAI
jgi:hypothetical protein